MNLALPSNLARMAVDIRFFQRQGLTAPTAVAAGTIHRFASPMFQGDLALRPADLLRVVARLRSALPASGGMRTLLWLVIGLVILAVVTLVVIRRLRRAIGENVRGAGGLAAAPRWRRFARRASWPCSFSEAWQRSSCSRSRSASSLEASATTSRSPSCSMIDLSGSLPRHPRPRPREHRRRRVRARHRARRHGNDRRGRTDCGASLRIAISTSQPWGFFRDALAPTKPLPLEADEPRPSSGAPSRLSAELRVRR